MNRSLSIAGLVLAGGQSSRFGEDKALARFGDRTLLHVALERFSTCRARAVSIRNSGPVADHARVLGAFVIHDADDSASGPFAGIAAGLVWARDNDCALLAVAPCDAPLLNWRHYERLIEDMGEAPAAFATTSAGEHPLCAVWSLDLMRALDAAMNGGSHPSVRSFLRGHGARSVAFEDVAPFANVNTSADLARIATEATL